MLAVRPFVSLGLVLLGVGCSRPPLEQEDGGGSGGSSGTVETGSTSEGIGLDGDESGVAPSCGNGLVEAEEECDGDDLAGGTCEAQGFHAGTLGCDAGCSYDVSECETPPLRLDFSQVKRFDFSWTAVPGAEHYQLFERPAPGQPYAQLGGDIVGTSASFEMPLHLRWQASYLRRACDADGCTDAGEVDVIGSLAEAVGYVKASNAGMSDSFGASVALSGDGNTLAVGAWGEDSSATGVDGDEADDSVRDSGAIFVFVRDAAGAWSQQAYVKASNPGEEDRFGHSLALSEDGSTLAVGAPEEDSNATGIDGDQSDAPNYYVNFGAAYVFVRNADGAWSQQAYVKASNSAGGAWFGESVALSGDGTMLAVGAIGESSNATGVGGNQADHSLSGAGAVYVFARDGAGAWSQQAYVKASNPDGGIDTGYLNGDQFGGALALSADGSTLAVGAKGEDSSATEVDGDQADDSAIQAGAVYVFVRDGAGSWSQQAYVKASDAGAGDRFGSSVALSGDGSTLATQGGTAMAYVFERDGAGIWAQHARFTHVTVDDLHGSRAALSTDGTMLLVSSAWEQSAATGIGGDQTDTSAPESGAAYVFVRDGAGSWSQQAYVKASNTAASDQFGGTVALSGDGNTLAVGAPNEDSSATGIGGDQTNDSAPSFGAVYLY